MQYIGKLDKEIYGCLGVTLVCDDVIITDRQIQHIKDRHSGDFECYAKYFSKIIAQPDYILEDSRPNTAFILKEIQDADQRFMLILRLHTPTDDPDYQHSVITFLKINERKYGQYLRNKKILYKRI